MLKKLKGIVKANFKYFSFFYEYLGIKLLFIVFFSIIIGLFDGLSISIFIPLLTSAGDDRLLNLSDSNSLYIKDILQSFNIPYTFNYLLLLMLIFFLIKATFKYYGERYRVFLVSYFIRSIRGKFLSLVSNISYASFVKKEIGTIQNSLSKECDNVIYGYTQYISIFQNIILVVVYVIMSFITSAKFTIMVVIVSWLSNAIFKKFYINSSTISNNITSKNNLFMSLLLQNISQFKYLKATSRISIYKNKVENVMNEIEDEQMKLGYISGLLVSLREPILMFFLVIAIYFQVNVMGVKFASILLTLLLFYRIFGSLVAVQTNWTGFLKYSGSINHIQEFKKELLVDQEIITGANFDGFKSNIEFKNVSFQYLKGKEILTSINLEIPKNKSIAFVGKSGSGKTTLINLLTGLLQPTSGNIIIDGEHLSSYNIDSYRQNIGFITQESVVFNDTFFNNVTFWAEKTKDNLEKFNEIIQKVDLSDFLNGNIDKEDIILGDNGVVMSGGQRQRLSIARELYRETEILVLDEATSALDSETEKFIQNSIESLKGKVTIIIIAHRLSTIKNVDLVCLLSNGLLEEKGTFNELVNKSEIFAQMVKMQEL